MKFLDNLFKKNKCLCHAQSKDLSHAKPKGLFRVECLCGEEGICDRLREMGFCESSIIEKVADSGSLICKVCDAKVILSKELAKNIIVKDICPCKGHSHGEGVKKMTISQMSVGQQAVIGEFHFDESDRLEEMGLTPGEKIEIIRYAPLGDPIEIKVKGYCLSLRKQEADQIVVVPI